MVRMNSSQRQRWPRLVVFLLILAVPSPLAAQELAWQPSLMSADDLSLSPAERAFSTPSCPEYRLLPVSDRLANCWSAFEVAADMFADDHGPHRHISGRQTLGQHHDVRHDLFVVNAEPGAGAAEAGDDLIGDQKDAVLVAELPQARQVAVG